MFESWDADCRLHKLIYKGMINFFIGIDFAKTKFDVVILHKDDLVGKGEHNQFSNTKDGVKQLEKWLRQVCGKGVSMESVICGENTGVYSVLAAKTLSHDGYTVCLESALRIKRSMGISRGKNDKKDARDIAEYSARHYDKLVVYQEPSQTSEALKTLFSQRRLLVKQRCDLQRRNKELNGLYKDNPLLKRMLASDTRIINTINTEIDKIEAHMMQIIEGDPEFLRVYGILTSMKGIALVNAVALIVYTDNFKRFDYDARRICSYWGIAPFANQSGTSINGKPHVSHFADHYLKSLLSQAVICAIRFCPAISNYAQRLIAKKKHISIVRNNCKNKMIHILVAMVKNDTYYGEIQKK